MRFAACTFGRSMPRTTCEDRLTFAPGFKQLALAYERSSVRTLVDIAVCLHRCRTPRRVGAAGSRAIQGPISGTTPGTRSATSCAGRARFDVDGERHIANGYLAGDKADGSQSRGRVLMLSEWPLRSPHWRQRSCASRSASRVKFGRPRVRRAWSMIPQRRQTASTRCHVLRPLSRKA